MKHPGGLSSTPPLHPAAYLAAFLLTVLGACGVDDRDLDVIPPSMAPPGGAAGQLDNGTAREPEERNEPVGTSTPVSITVDAGPDVPCAPGERAPECPAVVCPPDDLCRDFEPSLPAGTCVVPGRCATAADCIAEWTPASNFGGRCDCTGGTCGFRLGSPCATANECTSGACVASPTAGRNICCVERCPSGCLFSGNACEVPPVCTDGAFRCSGSDLEGCSGGQWVLVTRCGAVGCNPAGACNPPPSTPPPSTPPPSTPLPSTPPPTPVGQTSCSDLCLASDLVADGICEDGTVPGVFLCDPGTDCSDCGEGAEGCTDTCEIPEFNADGACDDGGAGSEFDVCDLGTDCTDCGARVP